MKNNRISQKEVQNKCFCFTYKVLPYLNAKGIKLNIITICWHFFKFQSFEVRSFKQTSTTEQIWSTEDSGSTFKFNHATSKNIPGSERVQSIDILHFSSSHSNFSVIAFKPQPQLFFLSISLCQLSYLASCQQKWPFHVTSFISAFCVVIHNNYSTMEQKKKERTQTLFLLKCISAARSSHRVGTQSAKAAQQSTVLQLHFPPPTHYTSRRGGSIFALLSVQPTNPPPSTKAVLCFSQKSMQLDEQSRCLETSKSTMQEPKPKLGQLNGSRVSQRIHLKGRQMIAKLITFSPPIYLILGGFKFPMPQHLLASKANPGTQSLS